MKVITKKSDCKLADKPQASPEKNKLPVAASGNTTHEISADTIEKQPENQGFSCDDNQCYVH